MLAGAADFDVVARYVSAIVVAFAILRVTLTPFLDDATIGIMEKKKHDARMHALIHRMTRAHEDEQDKEIEQAVNIARANADRLSFVEESVKRQGEALTKEIARAMDHISDATRMQTSLMERMQAELVSQGKTIVGIEQTLKFISSSRRKPNE